MVSNWVMIAVGIWAMVSPWILGFSSLSIAKWNSLTVGLVVVLVNVWIVFGGAADASSSGGEPEKPGAENKK